MQMNDVGFLFIQHSAECKRARFVSVAIHLADVRDLSSDGETPYRDPTEAVSFRSLPRRGNQDLAILLALFPCQCLDVYFGPSDRVGIETERNMDYLHAVRAQKDRTKDLPAS
jgi:hypothetical protein